MSERDRERDRGSRPFNVSLRLPPHRKGVCVSVCVCVAGLSSPQESSSLAEVSTWSGLRGDRWTPTALSSVFHAVLFTA